ncbi:Processing alpha glucosidase I [Orbilia oligospora]|uniref:Mannosyl-oligosaccharide glucosidase n=1 Tax=Orbilia oligospora TaxID=2813651 RepID=A0A7C8PIN7_ORBOL|nr:Processing alpha glucosidase I [Orbilia oligospora]
MHIPGLLVSLLWTTGTTIVAAAADQTILANEIQRVSNQSLLWGPYNPSLYFGMRPRIPKSLSVGLVWGNLDTYAQAQKSIRHTCEQSDDMKGYGWVEYDVRTGGKQVIHDQANFIDIEIELVKVPGGRNGGSWGARVKGIPREDAPQTLRSTVFFWATNEDEDGELLLETEPDQAGIKGSVNLKGNVEGLDEFHIELTEGPATNSGPTALDSRLQGVEDEPDVSRSLYRVGSYPAEHIWRVKNIIFAELKSRFDKLMEKFGAENLPPSWQALTFSPKYAEEGKEGNVHLVQRVYEGAFEFDILFSSDSAAKPMTSKLLTEKIQENTESFNTRFSKTFKRYAPFDSPKYANFAKDLFSNLLGGIGYFHGTSIIDRSEYPEDEEGFWEPAKANREKGLGQLEGPTTLYTLVPSRQFFPRGFLWDEGFHLLPVIEWDVDLAMEIVRSWFNLMDADGWIAREQILGEEARSKVPKEFQTQYPHYANPPTLLLVLTRFIEKWSSTTNYPNLTGELSQILEQMSEFGGDGIPHAILASAESYLKNIYPLLRRQYYWFRDTQAGDIRGYDRNAFSMKEGYRWRGRAPGYCLTSGIDDYPRAEPPHPSELHVDLLSWMGFSARLMKNIAIALSETDDAREYGKHEEAILHNIDDLHWNKEAGCYCDATVDAFEENIHVCHVGYVSIFPFLLGLVSDDDKLKSILEIIGDEEQLWSPFGLRSLSRQDEFYSKGENYWRGPVWINMNYLAILRLKEYGSVKGPNQQKAAKLYTELRKNVVNNVFRVWEETGFAWEQYEQEKGNGKGVQHFLGWTSLVVNIMALPETVEVTPVPGHDEL